MFFCFLFLPAQSLFLPPSVSAPSLKEGIVVFSAFRLFSKYMINFGKVGLGDKRKKTMRSNVKQGDLGNDTGEGR